MAKILIVDDDPDFVEATKIVLEKKNYAVSSAANGDEGLAKVEEEKPDLVILDVMMSSILDGLSMNRKLREHPELKDVPVVMVTSIANSDYAVLFPDDETIHIDGFMSKPISPDKLLDTVGKLVNGS